MTSPSLTTAPLIQLSIAVRGERGAYLIERGSADVGLDEVEKLTDDLLMKRGSLVGLFAISLRVFLR